MPYVQRDESGVIISLTREKTPNHNEFLAPTDTDIVNFLTNGDETHETATKVALSESDLGFTRATEDLINLLIQKNIILFTELPTAVQAKMAGREKLRSKLGDSPYNFLDDGDSI